MKKTFLLIFSVTLFAGPVSCEDQKKDETQTIENQTSKVDSDHGDKGDSKPKGDD